MKIVAISYIIYLSFSFANNKGIASVILSFLHSFMHILSFLPPFTFTHACTHTKTYIEFSIRGNNLADINRIIRCRLPVERTTDLQMITNIGPAMYLQQIKQHQQQRWQQQINKQNKKVTASFCSLFRVKKILLCSQNSMAVKLMANANTVPLPAQPAHHGWFVY